MREVVDQPGMNAVEKYNKLFHQLQLRREANRDKIFVLFEMLENEENLLFKHRFTKTTNEKITPFITSILKQGVKEKLFSISNVEETAFLILEFGNMYRTKIAYKLLELKKGSTKPDEITQLVKFIQETLEKLLGVSPGSLQIIKEFRNISLHNSK
jgi:hypothetical protein